MGGKQARSRKYLCLCITVMIYTALDGCVTLGEMENKNKALEYLKTAQIRFDQGDYTGSIKENRKVLQLYDGRSPGDEALFNLGLIYAHHEYSAKEFRTSLDHFRKLVTEFPGSPLVGRAEQWIWMLQEHERLRKKNVELSKTLKESKQIDIEIDEKKKALSKANEELRKEIEELNKTIKESKQIDIEIDEKKKEFSQ